MTGYLLSLHSQRRTVSRRFAFVTNESRDDRPCVIDDREGPSDIYHEVSYGLESIKTNLTNSAIFKENG